MTLAKKWRKLLAFGYALFLALWFTVSMFEIINTQINGKLFFINTPGHPYLSDFVNIYEAGSMVMSKDRFQVYDPAIQLEWTNKLIAPDHVDQPFFLQYPPFIFPLTAPLTFVSMTQAYWVWTILSLLFGIGSLGLALKGVGWLGAERLKYFLLGAIATAPSLVSLRLGQFSWYLLGLIALFWWSFYFRKDILAGFTLALTTLKPQYAPFFLIPVLVENRMRTLYAFAVTEALLLLSAGMTVGWSNVLNYPTVLFGAESSSSFVGVAQEKMANLMPLLFDLSPLQPGMPAKVIVLLIGITITAGSWYKSQSRKEALAPWAIAITSICSLLFSPHTHIQDLVFLAIPAAVTLSTVHPVTCFELKPNVLKLWHICLVFFPIISWVLFLIQATSGRYDLHLFSIFNLILLIVSIFCLRSAAEQKHY